MADLTEMVEVTVSRMRAVEAQRWTREIAPTAARFERGVYFAGGPEVIVAYAADGSRLGSVLAATAA